MNYRKFNKRVSRYLYIHHYPSIIAKASDVVSIKIW